MILDTIAPASVRPVHSSRQVKQKISCHVGTGRSDIRIEEFKRLAEVVIEWMRTDQSVQCELFASKEYTDLTESMRTDIRRRSRVLMSGRVHVVQQEGAGWHDGDALQFRQRGQRLDQTGDEPRSAS